MMWAALTSPCRNTRLDTCRDLDLRGTRELGLLYRSLHLSTRFCYSARSVRNVSRRHLFRGASLHGRRAGAGDCR